jgi:peptidoglycan LD-endopeptidase CwlK
MLYKGYEKKLQGVRPELVAIVLEAHKLLPFDVIVVEGVRTLERQKQLYAKGLSKTLNSRHLTGHAVDLAPIKGNTILWSDDEKFEQIADAMREVAIKKKTEVLWGRAWLMALNYYLSAEVGMDAYIAERRKARRSPFLDGPHFQLTTRQFP